MLNKFKNLYKTNLRFDFPVKKYFLSLYYKINGASEKISP